MNETLLFLCDELAAYCAEHGLPQKSADEIEPKTAAQREWLTDFLARWDSAELEPQS